MIMCILYIRNIYCNVYLAVLNFACSAGNVLFHTLLSKGFGIPICTSMENPVAINATYMYVFAHVNNLELYCDGFPGVYGTKETKDIIIIGSTHPPSPVI